MTYSESNIRFAFIPQATCFEPRRADVYKVMKS